MKRKWLLLGAVAAAVLLSLCIFDVRLRIAPRWTLSRALDTALIELDSRFENSPAQLFGPALDIEGRQRADLQLETQLKYLGVVRYDMSLQTQLNPCRINAAGTVITGGKALDLELFLDENFAAVSSQELVGGSYYGICYDSFSQDIRSRELLSAMIGDQTIRQWEESVSGLQNSMSRQIYLPEISFGDVPGILYGLLALKPELGREEIGTSGQQENAYTVSFRSTGQEIAAMAQRYLNQMDPQLQAFIRTLENDPNASVEAVFYLHKEKLVRIDAAIAFSGNSTRIQADLGQTPVTDPLSLNLEIREGEDLARFSIYVDTRSDDHQYEEKIRFSQTKNGVLHNGHLDYIWDYSSGEMDLSLLWNNREAEARLNLAGEGESLTIRTQDIAPLLNLFLKNPMEYPAICTLNLSPGEAVSVPEYRNLDQWTMEDLLTLLTGLGGLLGLKLS